MASAHNPSGSIPIEAVPSTSATPAVFQSSPGKRKELTVEDLEREIRRLDHYLVAVVLLLAFFLASFTAANSDVWMHLATGRLIAQGQYQFGADPFSYTSDSGQPWVNHAWLADLLAYGVAAMLGGPEGPTAGAVLVAVKALLIVALAGFMLLCCRRGPSLWIPVVFVALAVLAMSPRLLLQSRCFSFAFLGLTLYLLQRPRPANQTWPRHLFLLPVLFALWVNLDSWFLLGPLTVALYLLGQLIQRAVSSGKGGDREPRPGEIRQLAIILAVGLVACLLNPFHIRAFALPEELWALVNTGAWVRDDPYLQSYLASPLKPWMGWTVPGVTYYALVVLGLVSFFVAGAAWSWWRLLVWLVFAVLSLMLTRAIPFFAVAGGIIAALNWQDFVVQRFGARPSLDPRRKNWSLLGRTLTLLAGLVLLALAWPGWLHPHSEQARQARRSHRVAWAMEVDPSLHAAALKLAELRATNVLTDQDHGFNFSPDMANYCAWFCPQEKGFIDYRYPLFRSILATSARLRESLKNSPDGAVGTDADWPELFRERGINHVMVPASGDLLLPMRRFWTLPQCWAMLYGDGRTAIFGWIDSRRPGAAERWRGHEVNLNRLAFGPNPSREAQAPVEDADPAKGDAADVPRPVSWWAQYATGPAPRPLAVDEAAMYRTLFEDAFQRRKALADGLALFVVLGQDTFPRGGPGHSILQRLFGLFLDRQRQAYQLADHFFLSENTGPSPALVLAIRSARRALAANPDDADAYRQLGLAYLRQFDYFERGSRYPLLQHLRQIQIITAFQNVRTLKPDDPMAHLHLAEMYARMFVEPLLMNLPQAQPRTSFIDLEIEHRQAYVNLLRAAGPQQVIQEDGSATRKETPEEFSKRIERLEQGIKEREKAVDLQRRRNDYEVTTANKPPFEKAKRAVELGLVKQALDVLKEQAELPEEAKELAIRLYLATGEVQPLLDPETTIVGDRNNLLLRAAVGDYRRADSYLDQIVRGTEPDFLRKLLWEIRGVTFEAGLHPLILGDLIRTPRAFADQANGWVLWGLLALEEGATDKAAERFRKALELGAWPQYRAVVLSPLAAGSPMEALLLTANAVRQRTFGPVYPFATWPLANGYLRLLREARP